MEEGTGWEISIGFKWPHQGFALGYDLINATEDEPYNSVILHLGCFTIMFDFE